MIEHSTVHGVALRTRKIILTSGPSDAQIAAAKIRADEISRAERCEVEVDVYREEPFPGAHVVYSVRAGSAP